MVPFRYLYAEETSPRISSILIIRNNVFDYRMSGDPDPVYLWLNKLHSLTREETIRNELLFTEGEIFDPELLRESQSRLGRFDIFAEVDIKQLWSEDRERVDIVIETTDRWSTFFPLDFDYATDRFDYSLGYREYNLLGKRKYIFGEIEKNDRIYSGSVGFTEPRLFGSRTELSLIGGSYSNSEKRGHMLISRIWRPYRLVSDSYSWGLEFTSYNLPGLIYEKGIEISEFWRDRLSFGLFCSRTAWDVGPLAMRLTAGIINDRTEWISMDDSTGTACGRSVDLLYSSVDLVKYDFHSAKSVDRIGVEEEIIGGMRFRLSLGYDPAFSGYEDQGSFIEGSGFLSVFAGPAYFAFDCGRTFFYYRTTGLKEMLDSVAISGFLKHGMGGTAVFRADLLRADEAWGPERLYVGGFNGLRGFPSHFFNGSSMFRVNIEDRLLLPSIPLPVRISIVPFIDFGGVSTGSTAKTGLSTGIGIRFGGMESLAVSAFRIDLAFPLYGGLGPGLSIGNTHYFSPMRNLEYSWPGPRFLESIDGS